MPSGTFDLSATLKRLAHFLPSQAPLKDFIHHNTLHGFVDLPFHQANEAAALRFGYNTYLTLRQYRSLYQEQKIAEEAIQRSIEAAHGTHAYALWRSKMLEVPYKQSFQPRIGNVRHLWKRKHWFDLDAHTHPKLFRLLGGYLDQGVAADAFPIHPDGFLASVQLLEKSTYGSIFRQSSTAQRLLQGPADIAGLLERLVGRSDYYEQYLFDQQFAHPGWSGMAHIIHVKPDHLVQRRTIALKEVVYVELLLELDALETKLGKGFTPLLINVDKPPVPLFAALKHQELFQVLALWQEAYEWTQYMPFLAAMAAPTPRHTPSVVHSQALFCIDDREGSLRRYWENILPNAETYGTAGYFGLPAYFKPGGATQLSKVCPAPMQPRHVIAEDAPHQHWEDEFIDKPSKNLLQYWVIRQSWGPGALFQLGKALFYPQPHPSSALSENHMHPGGSLQFLFQDHYWKGMPIGFTADELAERLLTVFREIGLTTFSKLVYIMGHGASSSNNPHFSAYECGACSGRTGSVNARVFALAGNHPEVRAKLAERGCLIPSDTWFIAGLHDTTRDELSFFDLDAMPESTAILHKENERAFDEIAAWNATERSRNLMSIGKHPSLSQLHQRMKQRAYSIFEPRPELNHANNLVCIVGRRELTRHVFLDRRAFLNSYNCLTDPKGELLGSILQAVTPVCGGINLEYYYSKTDNNKLGAGSKLPHNIMGLIAVTNGVDSDLRTGLPLQMIEQHIPARLLLIIEHTPEVIEALINQQQALIPWFNNAWIRAVALHPETGQWWIWNSGHMEPLALPKLHVDHHPWNNLQRITQPGPIAPFHMTLP